MTAERYSELFSVIADYCTAKGWVPVGQRVFEVTPPCPMCQQRRETA